MTKPGNSQPLVILQMILRLLFVIQLVLGLLIWFPHLSLIRVHILLGVLFVIALWIQAGMCIAKKGSAGIAGFQIFWGLLMVVFGLTQSRILTGSGHWLIDILHLVAGIVGIGTAEMGIAKLKKS